MTYRTPCEFKLKEFVVPPNEGEPWIMVQADEAPLKIGASGYFAFQLRPGTTYEEAGKLVSLLNQRVQVLTFTESE